MRYLFLLLIPVLGFSQVAVPYNNDTGTGTTLNKLARLTGAPSSAIITATTITRGVVGVVTAGAGTSGVVTITYTGKVLCVFDGATTAGNYVQVSSSVAGDCHDAGSAVPTSGQILGKVTSTNGSGGTYVVDLTIQPTAYVHKIVAVFNGGGSALTSGTTVGSSLIYSTPVPFACTITAWTVTVDTGTVGFRVWRAAAGTAVPAVGGTLNGGDLAISTGTNLRSTTMTNFTGGTAPSLAANDILAFQLNAAATATYATVSLECQ